MTRVLDAWLFRFLSDGLPSKEISAMDSQALGFFLLIFVLWFVLNRWVLPWFGVPTCMSCGCAVANDPSHASPRDAGRDEAMGDEP